MLTMKAKKNASTDNDLTKGPAEDESFAPKKEDIKHTEIEVGEPSSAMDEAFSGLRALLGGDRGDSRGEGGLDGDKNSTVDSAVGGTRRDVTVKSDKLTGTAMMVNPVGYSDEAVDGYSMTQQYLNEYNNSPYSEDEQLWTRAVRNDRNPGGFISTYKGAEGEDDVTPSLTSGYEPYTSIPEMSRSSTYVDPMYSGQVYLPSSQALVISNQDYSGTTGDLNFAHADGSAMAAHFKSQGYTVDHQKDLKGAEITAAVQNLRKGPHFAGDSVAVHYAGHGAKRGLLGVDWGAASQSVFTGLASDALSGGYHAKVILDACHSGGMVSKMDTEMETLGDLDRDIEQMTVDPSKLSKRGGKLYDGSGKPTEITNLDDFYEATY